MNKISKLLLWKNTYVRPHPNVTKALGRPRIGFPYLARADFGHFVPCVDFLNLHLVSPAHLLLMVRPASASQIEGADWGSGRAVSSVPQWEGGVGPEGHQCISLANPWAWAFSTVGHDSVSLHSLCMHLVILLLSSQNHAKKKKNYLSITMKKKAREMISGNLRLSKSLCLMDGVKHPCWANDYRVSKDDLF